MTLSTTRLIPVVLLVDDDDDVHLFIKQRAEKMGASLTFVSAHDMEEGVKKLNASCFDAAIIDVMLPGVMGSELGDLLRKQDPHIPLAYLTNLDTDTVQQEARGHNAWYLFKQAYVGTTEGMTRLIEIIDHLAHLNPCLEGGIRIDNEGFQRKLSKTPIEIPPPFAEMLNHRKAMAAVRV